MPKIWLSYSRISVRLGSKWSKRNPSYTTFLPLDFLYTTRRAWGKRPPLDHYSHVHCHYKVCHCMPLHSEIIFPKFFFVFNSSQFSHFCPTCVWFLPISRFLLFNETVCFDFCNHVTEGGRRVNSKRLNQILTPGLLSFQLEATCCWLSVVLTWSGRRFSAGTAVPTSDTSSTTAPNPPVNVIVSTPVPWTSTLQLQM